MGNGKSKLGKRWTNQIYFDPRADKSSGKSYMEDDVLKLQKLIDKDENIEMVYAYKLPMYDWQLTDIFLHHMIIIFETRRWWWSIEKTSTGITIQRSRHRNPVLRKYRKSKRKRVSDIEKVESDKGRLSVFALIDWLFKSGELNKEYNMVTSNCQHFAKAVFDRVAKKKHLQIAT